MKKLINPKHQKETCILILAAGKGSRMKSTKPKILSTVKKISLLDHAVNKFKKLKYKKIYILISKKLKNIEKRNDCIYIYQKNPLGTGHAIKVSLKKINNKFKKIIVMYADTPFIHKEDIKKLSIKLKKNDLVLMGFVKKNNKSFGIIKLINKKVSSIVEFKNALKNERKINLCNSGIIGFKKKVFKEFLQIKKNKKIKEFLATDIVKILFKKKYKIGLIKSNYPLLCEGINSQSELKKYRKIIV
jgi:bifunctional N-acetylglucosamine-1-phosphate-uridyltransferase/glucosamine-1-phosphate-acetyltransferase GlmU-like protein